VSQTITFIGRKDNQTAGGSAQAKGPDGVEPIAAPLPGSTAEISLNRKMVLVTLSL
jgi:hypothetical protein